MSAGKGESHALAHEKREAADCPAPLEKQEPPRRAYVYMVECADGTLYTGWTHDVAQRVAAHNAGRGAKYTRSRLPVCLRYAQACADKRAAMQWEWALKQLSRAQKLELSSLWQGERRE